MKTHSYFVHGIVRNPKEVRHLHYMLHMIKFLLLQSRQICCVYNIAITPWKRGNGIQPFCELKEEEGVREGKLI